MFIRIDDISSSTFPHVEKILSFTQKGDFIFCIIPSEITQKEVDFLMKRSCGKVFFHGWKHTKKEFISSFKEQEVSFSKAKNTEFLFQGFCPPYNSFDSQTLTLLKMYQYKDLSIDYKSYAYYVERGFDFTVYTLWLTRYFFTKKRENGDWCIDSFDMIKREFESICFDKSLGVEIHPQYITSSEDWEKLRFLLLLLGMH